MKNDYLEFFINNYYCGSDVDLSFVSPIQARKFSKLDKLALSAMFKVYSENSNPNLVFASIHGQFDRLSKLTEQFKTDNEVSPIGFSSAVHNNTIGVFSLLNKLTSPYTAISAGEHTVSNAICEAVSQLDTDVLLCIADSFQDFNFAIACIFSKTTSENSQKVRLIKSFNEVNVSEYSGFANFLSDESVRYFNAPYFRLEKV